MLGRILDKHGAYCGFSVEGGRSRMEIEAAKDSSTTVVLVWYVSYAKCRTKEMFTLRKRAQDSDYKILATASK